MQNKIFTGIFILIVCCISLVIALDNEESPFNSQKLICRLEGYSEEECDMVVGDIYRITLAAGESLEKSYLIFPESVDTGKRVYSRSEINCEDPKQIMLVKYDNGWQAVEAEPVEQLEGGGLIIKAWIGEEGDYAVIQKSLEFLEDGEEDYCRPLNCGEYKAYVTDPYSGEVKVGKDISFKFCGMIDGCQAGVDESCSYECLSGSDPNCAAICTPEGGDCCDTSTDGNCDPDCWQKIETIDGDSIIIDSTDPDCLLGEGAVIEEEPVLEGWGKEIKITQGRTEKGSTNWQLFEKEFDKPRILDGEILFEVLDDGGEGVWFRDFTYTDLWGKEHTLFPLQPYPKEDNFDKGFLTLEERKIDLKDISETTNINELYTSARSFMVTAPFLWFQSEKDGEKAQFYLPPRGIKKISFMAASDDTSGSNKEFEASLKMNLWPGNGDPDRDNYTNYEDCHDMNPFIYPGAEERCNGLDDDCDSYIDITNFVNRYNNTLTAEKEEIIEWKQKRGYSGFYLMPCDGYIQYNYIDDGAYMEIWKNEACEPVPLEAPAGGEIVMLYPKVMGDKETTSCDAAEVNGPWQSYQAIMTYGDDTNCGKNHGVGACGDTDNGCIIGSHASCKIGALPESCDGRDSVNRNEYFLYFSRDGEKYIEWEDYDSAFEEDDTPDAANCDECAIKQSTLDLINEPEKRLELKEYEMIWAKPFYGCGSCGDLGSYDCDKGHITFDIYCYPKIERIDEFGITIDEDANCDIKKPAEVYVCSSEKFDSLNKKCVDKEWCSFSTQTYEGDCTYSTKQEDIGTEKEFYTYVCKEGMDCYLFYTDTFDVCTETETDCSDGVDNDCDGLIDRGETIDEYGEYIPADPDCEGECEPGKCRLETKEWCEPTTVTWTTPENYCIDDVCGKKDPSCMKNCEEGDKECGGGCLLDACDISEGAWCTSNGIWSKSAYCDKCGLLDVDCWQETGYNCDTSACDLVHNNICMQGGWREGFSGKDYCETDCGPVDSNCTAACEEGACDVYANKYCKAGSWQGSNYCAECGALDAECGTTGCENEACALLEENPLVCRNNAWAQVTKDEFCKDNVCRSTAKEFCESLCPAVIEETETDCFDGIDNDCDGKTDCLDEECSEVPECQEQPCNPGTERDCAPSGWAYKDADDVQCVSGSHTCSADGRWGQCSGYIGPETEICNSFDDDCDGSIDEGCECADGEVMACGTDTGSCSAGVQICKNGMWGFCYSSSYAVATEEICDGLDNDCDGKIDEGCPCSGSETQECSTDTGICEKGIQTCVAGSWGTCSGIMPMPETACDDGLDNDCDGLVDMDDESCTVTPADQRMPTCHDQIKNQGEELTDCGGPCRPCDQATCNDRLMNGEEESIDCGGKCPPCDDKKKVVAPPVEVCGDGYCGEGEDEENCEADCAVGEEEAGLGWLLYLAIALLALGGLGYYAYKKGLIKMKGKGKPEKPSLFKQAPKKSGMPPSFRPPSVTKRPFVKGKTFKTKEELELEKSLKAHKEILKEEPKEEK